MDYSNLEFGTFARDLLIHASEMFQVLHRLLLLFAIITNSNMIFWSTLTRLSLWQSHWVHYGRFPSSARRPVPVCVAAHEARGELLSHRASLFPTRKFQIPNLTIPMSAFLPSGVLPSWSSSPPDNSPTTTVPTWEQVSCRLAFPARLLAESQGLGRPSVPGVSQA
jgi:hypothetical protein